MLIHPFSILSKETRILTMISGSSFGRESNQPLEIGDQFPQGVPEEINDYRGHAVLMGLEKPV